MLPVDEQQEVNAPSGKRTSQRRPRNGQQHTFGEKLAHELGTTATKCNTDCNFALPFQRACQDQVGNVGARNQQQCCNCC